MLVADRPPGVCHYSYRSWRDFVFMYRRSRVNRVGAESEDRQEEALVRFRMNI